MIIIINGTSSSGKSTVAHALQRHLGDGWLYFSMDDYLSMLGAKYEGLHPDNPDVCKPNDIIYAKKHPDGSHEILIGELCAKLFATISDVLALIAAQGFNIIVDSFLTTMIEFNAYKEKLKKHAPIFIYLYASEKTITAREEARGDRLKGSAVHWLRSFECKAASDLCIDTDEENLEKIIERLLQKIRDMNTELSEPRPLGSVEGFE